MTDLERIGQRLVTGFPGTALTPELVQVVKEYKIGNIILFRENIASADQLRTLCADLQTLIRSETGHDAFIMIDQEGGAVTRLPECCLCPCKEGAQGGIAPENVPLLRRQKATVLLLGPGLGSTAQSAARAAEKQREQAMKTVSSVIGQIGRETSRQLLRGLFGNLRK